MSVWDMNGVKWLRNQCGGCIEHTSNVNEGIRIATLPLS